MDGRDHGRQGSWTSGIMQQRVQGTSLGGPLSCVLCVCRRFWPMCCLMRWTRNWSAVAAPSSAMQVLPTAAPDDRRDQERGGERLWPSLPGLERLGRSSQGSSDAVSPTGPSGPSEIASGSGAAAAGLRAVIAALQAFVLGWKGSVALGALGGLGGPRRMDALSAARHPAQALEAGSHYLSGASGYRELLAIGSFWLSGASGDGGQTRPRQTGRRQQPLLAAKQRRSPEPSPDQPMAC